MYYVSAGGKSVSESKLRELLSYGGEYNDLELKEWWDLETNEAKSKFIKALAALGTCPDGGYLIIGVNDNAEIVGLPDHRSVRFLESTKLGEIASKYIRSQPVARIHKIDDKSVALIYIPPHQHGIVVMEKASPDGGETFKEGVIYIRDKSSSCPMNPSQLNEWLGLLESRVLRAFFSQQLGKSAGNEMNNYNGVSVIRLAKSALSNLERHYNDEEGLTIAASMLGEHLAQAAMNSDADFKIILKSISHTYDSLIADHGKDVTSRAGFEIVLILESVGSLAVREGKIHLCAEIASLTTGHGYGSLLRMGQVMASRTFLKEDREVDKNLSLISFAKARISTDPGLRPDFPTEADRIDNEEFIEESLFRFDLIWCVIADLNMAKFDYWPSVMNGTEHQVMNAARFVNNHAEQIDSIRTDGVIQSLSNVLHKIDRLLLTTSPRRFTFYSKTGQDNLGLPEPKNKE